MRSVIRATGTLLTAIVLWAAVCAAQTPYRELTPGTSTRQDVDRILGAPTRVVSPTVVEYPSSPGVGGVGVEYTQSGVAEKIDVTFSPPVTRRALIAAFGLPGADGLRKVEGDQLVEYFSALALIRFRYVSRDPDAGVQTVSHFAPASFSAASGLPRSTASSPPPSPPSPPPGPSPQPGPPPSPPAGPQPIPPAQTPNSAAFNTGVAIGQALGALFRRNNNTQWSVNQQSSLEGTWLTQYAAQSADQCQSDCLRTPNCVAYVLVRAGATRAGDPAMCYLMSSVTRAVPSPCCIAGVKSGK